jgi:hypothetical protein
MQTAQTHSFAIPVVREILPEWRRGIELREAQRERVVASLLARP